MASALLGSSSCFNNCPVNKLKNSYLNNPTNLFHLSYPLTKNLNVAVCSRSSILTISNSQIQNGKPGFCRTTAASNSKIYKRLGTCLVVPPPRGRKPKAIIKFTGGAFIGAVPEVTYSYLLEQLASEGYFIVCVPYNVTFDHEKVTREVFERFHACYDVICEYGLPDFGLSAEEVVNLPLYSVGHSNGALLQVLTGSYFCEKIPKIVSKVI